MMNVYDAVMGRRSIRKFSQTPILKEDLLDLVDCARMAAYPANVQPLKFAVVTEKEMLSEVFSCTKWAGYLENGTPEPEQRPVAYFVVLGDRNIKKGGDLQVENGAACMTVLLAAKERGIASCWLGALNREKLRGILSLPEHLEVLDIVALGYPAQDSQAVEMKDGNVKYYLNEDGVLQVPKRSLSEVLYKI
ncbi:nitroreductase family protein [Ructibacterium gallinarum]|uniref:Nitroreductase family protein n=1 Tax=Ructibacterium gallinarum TaxID=2779355 RepID=A0A9D5M3Y0_9FIRM|nr:nitroreductase family protein [Ructibacterium gallinarum]MBE5040244.1 nitroreductase family protein [Ructibacterium gallinarum]